MDQLEAQQLAHNSSLEKIYWKLEKGGEFRRPDGKHDEAGAAAAENGRRLRTAT